MIRLFTVTEPNIFSLCWYVLDWTRLHDLLHVEVLAGEVAEWWTSLGHATPAPGVAAALLNPHLDRFVIIDVTLL